MRIRYCLPILLMLAGCSPDRGDPAPGDATRLAGQWKLVMHREGSDDILGTVTLTPSDSTDPQIPASLHGGTLDGYFQLTTTGWLPSPPTDSGTSAFLSADSAVVLYLRVEGRCTNCGNLGLAGRLTGDRVEGHWTQEIPGTPPQGSFTLERAGPS